MAQWLKINPTTIVNVDEIQCVELVRNGDALVTKIVLTNDVIVCDNRPERIWQWFSERADCEPVNVPS